MRKQKLRKEEEEFLEMYRDFLNNNEDADIVDKKLHTLNSAFASLATALSELAAMLGTVPNNISEFASTLHALKFTNYKALKESEAYAQVMHTCVSLKRTATTSFDTLAYNDELVIEPFTFSNFNLKHVFMFINDKHKQEAIVEHIKKIYADTCSIFIAEVFEPPVNIAKMSDIVFNAIKVLRVRIKNCNRAFSVIQTSVKQFETNYATYYKESVISGNNMGVVRSFISDLMSSPEVKESKHPALLIREFRTILKYLTDNYIDSLKKDPKTSKMLDLLKKFDILT